MRKAWVCGLALVLGTLTMGAAAQAQNDATPADKQRAVAYLEKTKNGVVEATKGLSDAQWNFKPAPDRWSIAEVVEHLAAAEDMLRGLVQEQV
ncbi:MAG TPA: DinB family protein, partial [Bryobacteraceae bacterium]|nr:DinB family protein [Bryobacteraceae bacterium]